MKFNFTSLDELKKYLQDLNIAIPICEDLEILKQPIKINSKIIPNALAVHPMEGCDGTLDGNPGPLTLRRYERFAKGGAGLLWVEASAISKESRANPRQLHICNENKEGFKNLLRHIDLSSKQAFGEGHKTYNVIQLTHSGRYSKPTGKSEPIIAALNPYLDKFMSNNYKIITDVELERIEDSYVDAAEIAANLGFDAVDIKSCHRYLNSELLSAYTREGNYGGSFENRTRFLLNIIDKIKNKLGASIDITLRMNAYDAIPYPYGFGVSKDCKEIPDLSEPIKLMKILYAKGVKLINISCGNPYYNPHVGRPFDIGPYTSLEDPIQSAAKMLNIVKELQQAVPDMIVIATGFTWFRDFAPFVAAGGIKEGWFKMAGFGRQAFAYPDFAKDIINNGEMDRNKCCITCSKCSEIMRDGGKTGCVIRDREVYGDIYNEGRKGKPSLQSTVLADHV